MLLFGGNAGADAPREIAGIRLGDPIATCEDAVDIDSALPLRHMEFVKEVEVTNLPGYKSGLIGFGTCARPGKILRIKLKYADGSKTFYKGLLKRFKKRFGEPDEYRGDPFHIFMAWKWSFIDKNNHRISLTLQHNAMDEDQKVGNAVKLTLSDLMEKERQCYLKKYPDLPGPAHGKKQPSPKGWQWYIPR
jgi:hypothetical protein